LFRELPRALRSLSDQILTGAQIGHRAAADERQAMHAKLLVPIAVVVLSAVGGGAYAATSAGGDARPPVSATDGSGPAGSTGAHPVKGSGDPATSGDGLTPDDPSVVHNANGTVPAEGRLIHPDADPPARGADPLA
jgi:hypothetical protein